MLNTSRKILLVLAAAAVVLPGPAATPGSVIVTAHVGGSVAGTSADHSFLIRNADRTPGRWDPCRTIRYRINADGAPRTAGQDVAEALRRISAATGLTFVRDGRTSIVPMADKDAHLPRRGMTTWDTEIIVAFSTSSVVRDLAGAVAGIGGGEYLPVAGKYQAVHGYAVFDRAQLSSYAPGFGSGRTLGSLYLHELGHAVGLGHAVARPQVMYGAGSPTATLQNGDRAGLAKLGRRAGCFPAPA